MRQLPAAHHNGVAGQPRGRGHQTDPTPAEVSRLRGRPLPAHPLVHHRIKQAIFRPDPAYVCNVLNALSLLQSKTFNKNNCSSCFFALPKKPILSAFFTSAPHNPQLHIKPERFSKTDLKPRMDTDEHGYKRDFPTVQKAHRLVTGGKPSRSALLAFLHPCSSVSIRG